MMARSPVRCQWHIEGGIATRDAAGDESPAEVMAMAFQKQPALSGRTRSVKPRYHRAVGAQHLEALAHLEPAVGEDYVALDRTERVIRFAREQSTRATVIRVVVIERCD